MNADRSWILPPDATFEEKQILLYSLLNIYSKFADPRDHLIIALVFELGYPQHFVAQVLDRDDWTVSTRVKKIRTVLTQTHKAFLRKDDQPQDSPTTEIQSEV